MSQVLIDTQALIWFAENDVSISKRALSLVDDPATARLTSVACLWEMAIKIGIKKLTLKSGRLPQFISTLKANQIDIIPVTLDDALAVADLPQLAHKDPFDRLIAARCLRQDLTLVSIDEAFDSYGVKRIW